MLTNQISQAKSIIKHGGVIAYSTDTILGIGCDPYSCKAVEKILWLKRRAVEKGLILLVADLTALKNISQPLTPSQLDEISSCNPTTPTTWLLPAQSSVPKWICGTYDTVAIRITNHPIANKLCEATGVIVSTSANFSDYSTVTDQQQLKDWFGPYLDYVIIGPPGTGLPSEVRDLISGNILRKTGKTT